MRTPVTSVPRHALFASRTSAPIIASLVAAATVIAAMPFIRHVAWLGDEGILLHGAQRMLAGEVLYRDFFAIMPPAGYALITGWMAVFGADFLHIRIFAVLVIALIAVLAFYAGYAVTKRPLLPACLAVFWAVCANGDWTVVSHHWMTTLWLMGASVLLLAHIQDNRYVAARLLLAGALIGLAAMTTSSRGAAAAIFFGIIVLTSRRHGWLAAVQLGLGIAVVPLLLTAWLASKGALWDGLQQFVVYAGTNYSDIQSVPFGSNAIGQRKMGVMLYPACLALIVLATFVSRFRCLYDPAFRAAALLACMAWITSYPRPDAIHLLMTAPVALPCIAACSDYLRRGLPVLVRWVALAGVVVLMLPSARQWYWSAARVADEPVVQTLRGAVRSSPGAGDDALKSLLTALERIPAQDGVFFYPYDPMLPYLAGRKHVATLDVFAPGYTSKTQYATVCREMLRQAQWVVFDYLWTDPKFLKVVFPAMKDGSPPEKALLESVIAEVFEPTDAVTERFAVLRRKEPRSTDPSTCALATQ